LNETNKKNWILITVIKLTTIISRCCQKWKC